MRFRDIQRGTRARRPVPLPMGDGPLPLPVVGEDGSLTYPEIDGIVVVDVRVLRSDEEADALAAARAYAKSKGLDNPRDGDSVYDLAVKAFVVAASYVDHSSPPDVPIPFFVDGAEASQLDTDRIAYLYEAAARFQDECSPKTLRLSGADWPTALLALAGEEDDSRRFFERLRPGMQWSLARTLASLLLSSQTRSASSGSPTAESGPSDGARPQGSA